MFNEVRNDEHSGHAVRQPALHCGDRANGSWAGGRTLAASRATRPGAAQGLVCAPGGPACSSQCSQCSLHGSGAPPFAGARPCAVRPGQRWRVRAAPSAHRRRALGAPGAEAAQAARVPGALLGLARRDAIRKHSRQGVTPSEGVQRGLLGQGGGHAWPPRKGAQARRLRSDSRGGSLWGHRAGRVPRPTPGPAAGAFAPPQRRRCIARAAAHPEPGAARGARVWQGGGAGEGARSAAQCFPGALVSWGRQGSSKRGA